MPIIPYIHFSGDCAEAMASYADLFGAAPPQIMRYRDAPEMAEVAEGTDLVMHSEIHAPGGTIMASDYPPGMAGEPQQGMSIMYGVADAETGRRIFERLATEGGGTIMDYGPTFWSSGFGMVKDRFGTHWMIAAPAPAA